MHRHSTKAMTLTGEHGRIGGYLVVWGDASQRDLHGEYFTPQTEFALDWFEMRPVLYQHGLDEALKASVIGQIDALRVDDIGIWAEAQLDTHHRYMEAVLRLIEQGVLSWSSGSVSHLVDVADDGWIKRWVLVEGSLTPNPAEPRCTDVQTIKHAYEALGLDSRALEPQSHNQLNMNKGHMMNPQNPRLHTQNKMLPASQQDAQPRVTVGSHFDGLDTADLLHGYMLLRAGKSFQGVSEQYANALAYKLSQGGSHNALKADELAYTTQTGYGDEWVAELWSQQIWQKAREDNVILPLFRSIEMPSNPFDLPVEGTDPTVYYVPETSDADQMTLGAGNPIPSSKIGTGKVQLNAKKLALRVGFSSELVEDSIIPVLSIYREQATRAITDSIDHALLNGDTATSNNINDISVAPTGNERFLIFDGLRKLPVSVNTANRKKALNLLPTLAALRETRFLMQSRYAARPADLAWLVDSTTYANLLNIPEFLTMDKAGVHATAQTGQLGFIDGIPVFVTPEMPLTDANGKIDSGSATLRGNALCVYRPGWFVGYRRRIAVNVDYIPYYDSYQLTATVRLAFNRFDNDVASLLTDIKVD